MQKASRFIIIERTDNLSFKNVSPFVILKFLKSLVGNVITTAKIKDMSALLVEIANDKQSNLLLAATSFCDLFPIKAYMHPSLNSSKGVISCYDLMCCSTDEIKAELASQNVTDVYRITRRVDGQSINTATIILTFSTNEPPKKLIAGYHSLTVRPYVPNPTRCFICQRFGHTKAHCKGKPTCPSCGLDDHGEEACVSKPRCINCSGEHAASSKNCKKWLEEKKICEFRTIEKLSYRDARQKYLDLYPASSLPTSYVSIASSQNSSELIRLKSENKMLVENQKKLEQILSSQSTQINQLQSQIHELTKLLREKIAPEADAETVEQMETVATDEILQDASLSYAGPSANKPSEVSEDAKGSKFFTSKRQKSKIKINSSGGKDQGEEISIPAKVSGGKASFLKRS